MNERLTELISQAQKEVWGNNPYNGSPEFEGYELDAEKFAELVVKETIDEMITQMWKYGIDESNNPQFYKIIDRTIQEMLDVAPSKD